MVEARLSSFHVAKRMSKTLYINSNFFSESFWLVSLLVKIQQRLSWQRQRANDLNTDAVDGPSPARVDIKMVDIPTHFMKHQEHQETKNTIPKLLHWILFVNTWLL